MIAAQYDIDIGIDYCPVSVTRVVRGQLFPHGGHRSTFCRQVWHESSSSVDDRLIKHEKSYYQVNNHNDVQSVSILIRGLT